ncbi:hypothetical protein [Chitinimonas sp.]|uniref:hypothetical protein n=1 Tax=Chitinimonas sp. TaxID=1934313 RepID=UPI0035B3ED26
MALSTPTQAHHILSEQAVAQAARLLGPRSAAAMAWADGQRRIAAGERVLYLQYDEHAIIVCGSRSTQ